MRNWIVQTRQRRPIIFWIALILLIFPALMGFYEALLVGLFWVYWQAFGGLSEETIDITAYALICVGIVLAIVTTIWLGRIRAKQSPTCD